MSLLHSFEDILTIDKVWNESWSWLEFDFGSDEAYKLVRKILLQDKPFIER